MYVPEALMEDKLQKEKELLRKVADGDQQAFAELFQNWYPLLSTQIKAITRSFELTQEIVQDVFMKIWMARESLAGIENVKGYIWVMANNQAYAVLKKQAIERKKQKEWEEGAHVVHTSGESEDIFISLLDQAIARLPPQQQKVFLLSRRQRRKQAEIAMEMGISIGTVKAYLQLAVRSVTAFIKEHYPA